MPTITTSAPVNDLNFNRNSQNVNNNWQFEYKFQSFSVIYYQKRFILPYHKINTDAYFTFQQNMHAIHDAFH